MRERVLTILGVIAVVGVVAYPLAHRISTSAASATLPPVSATPSTAPRSTATPPPPTIAPTPTPVVEGDSAWTVTADVHRGANGQAYTYTCPPNGTIGRVWGSFEYTDDSSVCTAAVHAGVITVEDGGTVDIVILDGAEAYQGSFQYGVRSLDWEAFPGSFAVMAAAR